MMALPWEIMFNELLDIEVEDADVSQIDVCWFSKVTMSEDMKKKY